MSVSLDDLPGGVVSLAEHHKWVCWSEEKRRGKLTKIPLQARNLQPAAVGKPETYATYHEAAARLSEDRIQGIGFVIDDDTPFTCIDLDWKGEVNRPHVMPLWARKVVRHFRSYTEWSPSGYGVHIWIEAKLPEEARNRTGGIEIYSRGRYMTVTAARVPLCEQILHLDDGETVEGWDTDEIEERQGELTVFHGDVFPPADKHGGTKPPRKAAWVPPESGSVAEVPELQRDQVAPPWASTWPLTDALNILNQCVGRTEYPAEAIREACEADKEFKRVWERNPTQAMRQKLGEDHSAWDLALCNKLFDMELDWEPLLATLIAYRSLHVGDDKVRRMDYWARTISRCSSTRAHVAKVQRMTRSIEHLQGITSTVEEGEHLTGSSREEAIATFNEMFPDEKGRIKQLTYWRISDRVRIEFLDGIVEFCHMKELINLNYWRVMLARCQYTTPPFKPKQWGKVYPCLFPMIEEEEDEENSWEYRGRELLRRWSERHSGFAPLSEWNARGTGPWLCGGKVTFNISELHNCILTMPEYRDIDRRMLSMILIACGCQKYRLTYRHEGKTVHGPRTGIYRVEDADLNQMILSSNWIEGEEEDE